ncbi:MAG: YIP1 family protein [Pseudomonadota bacterium]
MSVTLDILRTYRTPGQVLRRRVTGPPNEPRALITLMSACILMFAAQMPGITRRAYLDPTLERDQLMSSALMGWVFIMPLVFYLIAALSHAVARPFGGKATWFEARMALFWALLAAAPAWLFVGLVQGFLGYGIAHSAVGVLAGVAFLIFWGAGLREVERGPA